MACPSPQELAESAAGRSPREAEITAHVAGCEVCGAHFQRLLGEAGTLHAAADPANQDPLLRLQQLGRPRAFSGSKVPRGTLIGRYLVLDVLGEGGMGTVLSAYDPELNRRVAIKLLRVELAEGPGAAKLQELLLHEARAMAQLAHPNVVTVHDVGTFRGAIFLAMEWVEGPTLLAWQAEAPRRPREILAHYLAAGHGLAAAHGKGIVHRDFKPANVLLGGDGRVRVSDFGLARVLRLSESPAAQAREPVGVMGTVGYMAPEQVRGKPADARADQFSFCAALYQALYGELPYDASSLERYAQSLKDGTPRPPPPKSRAPRYLRPVLLRGLSVDPEARFASMEALLVALKRDPRQQQQRVAGAALAALAVVGIGLGAHGLLRRERERCARESAGLLSFWSPEARQGLGAHAAKLGLADGASLARRTTTAADRYATTLRQAQTSVCEAGRTATDARDTRQLEQLHRQTDCLALSRAQFRRTLGELQHSDLAGFLRGPNLLAGLTPVEDCRDRRAPSAADDDEALGQKLVKVRLLFEEDRNAQSAEAAQALVAEATAKGAQELAAEARYQQARAAYDDEQPTEIVTQLFRDAQRRAEVAGNDLLAAQATDARYWVRCREAPPPGCAELRLDAEAAVERVGAPRALAVNELLIEADVDVSAADYPRARAEMERAQALLGDADETSQSDVRGQLETLEESIGDYPKAHALSLQVLAASVRDFGPHHPTTALATANLAQVELYMGDLKAAEAHARQAVADFSAVPDAEHNTFAPWALSILGRIMLASGDVEGSRRALLTVQASENAQPGVDSTEAGVVHDALGRAALAQDKAGEAAAELEQAVALLSRRPGNRRDLADARLALARALEGSEPARAHQLAEAARAAYAAARDGDKPELAAAERWLSAHPGR